MGVFVHNIVLCADMFVARSTAATLKQYCVPGSKPESEKFVLVVVATNEAPT